LRANSGKLTYQSKTPLFGNALVSFGSYPPTGFLTFLRFSGHWIKRLGALPVRGCDIPSGMKPLAIANEQLKGGRKKSRFG
jgi:hypothetical protein